MRPDKQKQMMSYLTRPARELIETGQLKFASDLVNPDPRKDVIEIDAINSFMKRNPRADGGRIGFNKGERVDLDYINLTRIQNAKENKKPISDASKFKNLPGETNITYTDYQDKQTGKKFRRYNVRVRQNVDGVQKTLTKGPEFQEIISLDKAKKIRDDFREKNPKNIKPRDPEKDYISKDQRRKYEVLKQGRMIKFGAGKGSVVHHMLPLAGKADVTTSDLAKISAKMNTNLSQFDKPMNKLVNEAYALDFSKENSLKRLDEINKELAGYVKQSVTKLGPKYKGLLGFNKLTPVLDTFDEKGNQVFDEVPQGLDFKKSIAGKKGGEAVRNIKTKDIQKMVSNAPKLKAAIPGIETLFKTAASIGDDVKKAKYLKAGFKTLGIAAAPLVIYDTYKAFEQGKPILESLEQGLIGTDLIGGTKRILALTPEEREARSVVKQDALKDLNVDMPMGFGFIEGPTPDSNLTLPQAQQKMESGIQRVLDLETQKNLQRSQNRGFGTPVMADQLLSSGGVASGPPPEKGPNPQGLLSLMKRARNY